LTPENSQFFRASLENSAKRVSAIVFAILAGIAIFTGNAVVGGISAVMVAAFYAFAPRGYSLSGRTLLVRRLAGSVRIHLDELSDARPATADDISGASRVLGNGGLFGYYGLFRTPKLGTCHWYVTNRNNAVLLFLGEKTVVISPDDVPSFRDALRVVAPLKSGASVSAAPGKKISSGIAPKLIGAVSVLAIAGLAASVILYAPGPPAVTLTQTSLAIHDRFYPVTLRASTVNTDGIRVVDIKSDAAWRATARTNGFSNAHYHSGWYRVASGKTVRMYRAEGSRLVLIPGKSGTADVLLETSIAPDAFAQQLRQEWAGR
jgi:hypothetical protein